MPNATQQITKIVKCFNLSFTTSFLTKFFMVFFLSVLIVFIGENALGASKKNEAKFGGKSHTRIRSDIIDIKRKSQTINFIGNVVVEKDDSSLLAEKMLVIYSEESEANGVKKSSEIKKIEAQDNVKIFSEEFVASSDYGYFDPKKNIFVLQKNVIVNNGSSIAAGDHFIYSIASKKGKFIGDKKETTEIDSSRDKRVVVIIGETSDEKSKK